MTDYHFNEYTREYDYVNYVYTTSGDNDTYILDNGFILIHIEEPDDLPQDRMRNIKDWCWKYEINGSEMTMYRVAYVFTGTSDSLVGTWEQKIEKFDCTFIVHRCTFTDDGKEIWEEGTAKDTSDYYLNGDYICFHGDSLVYEINDKKLYLYLDYDAILKYTKQY
jgi:hypothetical protein